ncbi:hypothetical protein [Planomonospora sp. ID82291]|uniref:hypothetical protein n=1 Tax=Planomonospora sp. ID82291 TaxID=2738136 RepID=UPI0018C3F96E|nr:hypothetical protein [Planomonospora sp. ID82291]MBG0818439.1 hypothetical protein [Planomonospora sp. ID82291]
MDKSSGRLVTPRPRTITGGREPLPSPSTARAAALAALPDGLVCAASRALWLRITESHPDAGHRRADWRRGLQRIVWQLATRTGSDMVTAPRKGATWAVMAAEAGVSRSVLADRLAWLRERGLLVTAVTGSTPRYRPGTRQGLLEDGWDNMAAEYILTVPADLLEAAADELDASPSLLPAPAADPAGEHWTQVPWPVETLPVDVTRTPSSLPPPSVGGKTSPYAGARESAVPAAPAESWPAAVTPRTKLQMLAACERLRAEDLVLRRVRARHLRSLLRPAFALGATIDDVRHALNHRGDGTPWPYTDRPRWVPSWLRSRLATWISADGDLLATWPSQQRAAASARSRAEQERRGREYAAARADRGDATRNAARARELLMAASPAARTRIERSRIGAA